MTAYLLTLLLLSPMVTNQQTQWDTLNVLSLHVVAGGNVGSSLTDPGAELGLKAEYLVWHPIAMRVGGNFNMSGVNDFDIGVGTQESFNVSAEVFTYRGKNDYFIYLGLGALYNFGWYDPSSFDGVKFYDLKTDTVYKDITILDADMSGSWGYLAFLGGRYKQKYSFELGFRVTKPDFVFLTQWPSPDGPRLAEIYRPKQISTMWVRIGYIIPI